VTLLIVLFRLSKVIALAAILLASLPAAGQEACEAPAPVCDARRAVFVIASWDPFGSAVLVGPDRLVTNRHIVADREQVTVKLADGGSIEARVIPTAYRGDLVLLEAKGLPGATPPPLGAASLDGTLYVVAAELRTRRIAVHKPGRVVLLPAEGKPLARLHHSAASGPGTSGGAVVDADGRLVAIVAAGGEGRNEAIPSSEIARLEAASGPARQETSQRIGTAYRECAETLERIPRRRVTLARRAVERIVERCTASGNRQLFDLAGQVLGRAGRHGESAALFGRALDQDPHAINARIGLVVTLHFALRHRDAVPHLEWLLQVAPADAQVLRLAVQAGRFGGNSVLAERALQLIEEHHPRMAPAARGFLGRAGPGGQAPRPRR
jgi:hypothetical protein